MRYPHAFSLRILCMYWIFRIHGNQNPLCVLCLGYIVYNTFCVYVCFFYKTPPSHIINIIRRNGGICTKTHANKWRNILQHNYLPNVHCVTHYVCVYAMYSIIHTSRVGSGHGVEWKCQVHTSISLHNDSKRCKQKRCKAHVALILYIYSNFST